MTYLSSNFSEVGPWFPTFLIALLVGMWLLGRFSGRKGNSVESGRGSTLAALYACMYLAFAGPPVLTAVALVALAGLALAEWYRATRSCSLNWKAAGTLIITTGIAAFMHLRGQPHGSALCLFAFFMINIVDTAAYFCGRIWGRTKLAPIISPGKTIEGSVGAVICSVPLAFAFRELLDLPFRFGETLFYALTISLVAQLGDLLASLAKRRLGIKDYGKILPGHGGILDRFDSSLLAVPVFWISLFVFNNV